MIIAKVVYHLCNCLCNNNETLLNIIILEVPSLHKFGRARKPVDPPIDWCYEVAIRSEPMNMLTGIYVLCYQVSFLITS